MKPESLPQRLIGSISSQLANGDRVSLVSLLVANLLPVFFALIFGWDVGGMVMFYWWENIVIGGYAIPRILLAKQEFARQKSGPQPKLLLIPFFCFHYFFFCMVHGALLMVFVSFRNGLDGSIGSQFGHVDHSSWPGPTFVIPVFMGMMAEVWSVLPVGGFLSVLGLVASHGVSYFRNYIGKREFEKTTSIQEMFRPYGRIVLLHVCIIFGGAMTMLVGSPLVLVMLLMIGKTLLDAVTHSASHSGRSIFHLEQAFSEPAGQNCDSEQREFP